MLTNHLRRQLRGAAVDRLKVPQGNKSMQRAMRTCMALTAICCGATVVPAPAHAQSSVDKDQYSLFDPVPDSEMRSFSTDRPTKSNVPYTVDAGHYQYETDIFNFSYMRTGSITMTTLLAPNPTLKVGLTNNIDFEVNWASIRAYRQSGHGHQLIQPN